MMILIQKTRHIRDLLLVGCLVIVVIVEFSNTTRLQTHLVELTGPTRTTTTKKGPAHFYCLCPTLSDPSCDVTGICDTILTYKDPIQNRRLNLSPASTWTAARNFMYQLAKRRRRAAQLRQQPVPSHSCFVDGDTKFGFDVPDNQVGKERLLGQLQNEIETDKIISFNYRNVYFGHLYQFGADANANCFADESIDDYLPYSILYDEFAWSLSQRELWGRANTISPFVFKVYQNVSVWNPVHAEYPRDDKGGVRADLIGDMARIDGWEGSCLPPNCTEGTKFSCTFPMNSAAPTVNSPPALPDKVLEFTLNRTHTCGYMSFHMY